MATLHEGIFTFIIKCCWILPRMINVSDKSCGKIKLHILFISVINLLAPELFFFNFSTPVYKMWIVQEPNKLDLWNKLHFEEEKRESIYHV